MEKQIYEITYKFGGEERTANVKSRTAAGAITVLIKSISILNVKAKC